MAVHPRPAIAINQRTGRSGVRQWRTISVRLVLVIGLFAPIGCGGGADSTPAAPPAAPTPAPDPPPTPPGQPTGIRVVDVGLDYLVWAWDPVETATGYEGHAFPDGTPVSERPPLQVTVEPTFRADGLEPDTAMVFFVRAVRETAGGRAVGPWSDQGTGKTLPPPSPPMTVTGTVRASGGPAPGRGGRCGAGPESRHRCGGRSSHHGHGRLLRHRGTAGEPLLHRGHAPVRVSLACPGARQPAGKRRPGTDR